MKLVGPNHYTLRCIVEQEQFSMIQSEKKNSPLGNFPSSRGGGRN